MPAILEAREICERALRKIGVYSINDAGAAAAQMDEAMHWLDLVIGHTAAKQRAWWLVAQPHTLAMVPGQTEYRLSLLSGTPDVAAVVEVVPIALATGRLEAPLPPVRRWQWDQRDLTMRPGPPCMVYVDRANDPTLYVHPAPAASPTHNLRLTLQRFSEPVLGSQRTAPLADMRRSWNLYLVTALAAQLGNGPITRQPADEVRDMQAEAAKLLLDLESWDAHEQVNEPRRVEFYDF